MIRFDLAARVATVISLSKAEAESAVNTLLSAVADALARRETVSIPGFGNCSVKSCVGRLGRNL